MGGRRRDLKSATKRARMVVAPSIHAVPRPNAQHFSEEDVLEKAEELLETGQYELAVRFCDKILAADGEDVRALECKALACLELEQTAEARELLTLATALAPEDGHSKFMYLAQLSSGQEAVTYFSQGISLLHAELERVMTDMQQAGGQCDEDTAAMLQQCTTEISAAFCSVAEIYLSDLCTEEGAQEACINCAEKALEYDPQNVQAMQTMASIHISLQQPEAALKWLDQSLKLWHHPPETCDADEEEDDEQPLSTTESATAAMDTSDEDEDAMEPPPFLFRINTVRLLIELQQLDQASEVLDILLAEDDSVVQVWYLLGWTHHLQEDFLTAAGYFHKMQQVYATTQCDDEPVLIHAQELLASYPAFTESVPVF